MLKNLLAASLVGVSIFCAGCGDDKASEKPASVPIVEQQTEDKAQLEKIEAEKKAAKEKEELARQALANVEVCASPGIGDSLKAFSAIHNMNRDNGMLKNFDNDHFIVIADESDRLIHITIQSGNGPRDSIIDQMIPSDATEVQRKTDNSDTMVSRQITTGKSANLALAIPESDGKFILIDSYDSASQKYLHSVIGTGDKP